MEIGFHGKRVLVTGAGKGIGRDLVKTLVSYGADVVALSRSEEPLISLKRECPTITTVVCDVGDWEETKKIVEGVCPVHMLVNNAAYMASAGIIGEISEENFDRYFAVNVKGPLNISQVVANDMRARGAGGSIVNISSVMAFRPMAGKGMYALTKAALDQMTRVMAVELGPHHIRVNTVNPGLVWSDAPTAQYLRQNKDKKEEFESKIPLKRASETSDVVNAVLYLLSDKSSMVHGTNFVVDGGHQLM